MDNMSEEQAADFAALSAAAAEPSAVTVQAEQQAEQQQTNTRDSMAAEIAGLMDVAVKVLGVALPSIKAIYTPEAIEAASSAIAAVCAKHGWLAGGLFEKWGEEIGAAVVLLPLGYATVQGVKADIAAAKQKQGIGTGGATLEATATHHDETPEAAPGAKSVQFGNVAP